MFCNTDFLNSVRISDYNRPSQYLFGGRREPSFLIVPSFHVSVLQFPWTTHKFEMSISPH
jgi:hypothetical protein